MAYFQISDLNLALNDFDSALQLDKTALQAIYFKAWTLELQKKYEESNLLYTQLVTLTGKNFFRVFAAIVQRKKIES
jgi:tetratricopeptide (TPR) repeat protein